MKHIFSLAVIAGLAGVAQVQAADYTSAPQQNTYQEIPYGNGAYNSTYNSAPRQANGYRGRQSMVERESYFYAGGELGRSSMDYPNSNVSSDSDTLAGIFGGYAFNENFRAEVAIRSLAADEHTYYDGGYYVVDEYNQTALQLSGLAVLPLNKNVSFYARAGVAFTEASNTISEYYWRSDYYPSYRRERDKSETVLLGGLGMEFRLWRELHLNVDYTAYEEAFNSDVSTLAIGVKWHFR